MLYVQSWDRKHEIDTLETWQVILLQAADLIEKEGWIRLKMHTNNGYCMVGAIEKVGATDAANKRKVFDKIGRRLPHDTISHWNDAVAEDKAQVVNFMREAASG